MQASGRPVRRAPSGRMYAALRSWAQSVVKSSIICPLLGLVTFHMGLLRPEGRDSCQGLKS